MDFSSICSFLCFLAPHVIAIVEEGIKRWNPEVPYNQAGEFDKQFDLIVSKLRRSSFYDDIPKNDVDNRSPLAFVNLRDFLVKEFQSMYYRIVKSMLESLIHGEMSISEIEIEIKSWMKTFEHSYKTFDIEVLSSNLDLMNTINVLESIKPDNNLFKNRRILSKVLPYSLSDKMGNLFRNLAPPETRDMSTPAILSRLGYDSTNFTDQIKRIVNTVRPAPDEFGRSKEDLEYFQSVGAARMSSGNSLGSTRTDLCAMYNANDKNFRREVVELQMQHDINFPSDIRIKALYNLPDRNLCRKHLLILYNCKHDQLTLNNIFKKDRESQDFIIMKTKYDPDYGLLSLVTNMMISNDEILMVSYHRLTHLCDVLSSKTNKMVSKSAFKTINWRSCSNVKHLIKPSQYLDLVSEQRSDLIVMDINRLIKFFKVFYMFRSVIQLPMFRSNKRETLDARDFEGV